MAASIQESVSPAPTTTKELWDSVLNWLATFEGGTGCVRDVELVDLPSLAARGLVITKSISANTPLITIPSSALLNTHTLRHLYPSSFLTTLTSTQYLSLHLALSSARILTSPPHPRDRYRPFLETLPTEFPTVPLTWLIGTRTTEELKEEYDYDGDDLGLIPESEKRIWLVLLRHLPKALWKNVSAVERRFREDWKTSRKIWDQHCEGTKDETDVLNFENFLLGWLNVNTRCLYFDLGKKKTDNLTLCPVIDMINHKNGLMTHPQQTTLSLKLSSPPYASPDPPLSQAGQEVLFSYNAHEDPLLFAEYGFILSSSTGKKSVRNEYNNVPVDETIEKLFADAGRDGERKKEILMEEGYWGEMTFQSTPPSASYRVLTALRLLHFPLPRSAISQQALDLALDSFYALLRGDREILSSSNEAAVTKSLRFIGEELEDELEKGEAAFEKARKAVGGLEGVQRECWAMVGEIWKGEREIVREVLGTL